MAITALLLFNAPTTLPESKVRPPRKVTIIKVQSSDHRISVRAHGTVIPVRTVDIEPQVTGPIISHHPSLVPGGVLEEGESLFVIDGTLTQLELQEASASVNRAKAMLAESKRKQRQAQQLANERVIADTELAAIESLVQIQTAELQRLNAGRDRIRELLDRHVVHAPFNALVLMESVEIGQQVDPGFVAATLVGTDAYWVQASIPVGQLRWIKLPNPDQTGSSVEVFMDKGSGNSEKRQGHVVQLLGNMEEQGRMARLLIEIKEPRKKHKDDPSRIPLLIGSYVRVQIDAGILQDVIAIDRNTLREGNQVWVVDNENRLQIRDVVVRWKLNETVYIDNTLNPDESLIISPLRVALPGMHLNPVTITMDASSVRSSITRKP